MEFFFTSLLCKFLIFEKKFKRYLKNNLIDNNNNKKLQFKWAEILQKEKLCEIDRNDEKRQRRKRRKMESEGQKWEEIFNFKF